MYAVRSISDPIQLLLPVTPPQHTRPLLQCHLHPISLVQVFRCYDKEILWLLSQQHRAVHPLPLSLIIMTPNSPHLATNMTSIRSL